MPVIGMTPAEIAAATQAVIQAGGKSTDRANRLPGETATEANARITAAYKAQPIPELSKEGKAAGATMEFVRTGAGGVGEYKEIFPMGSAIPTTRTTEFGNIYDKDGNLVQGTGLKTGVAGTSTAQRTPDQIAAYNNAKETAQLFVDTYGGALSDYFDAVTGKVTSPSKEVIAKKFTPTTTTTTTPTTGDAAATAAAAKAAADKAAADAAAKAAADKAAADKAAADAAAAGGKGLSKAEIDAAIAAAVKAATAGTVSKSDLDRAIATATAEAEARAKAQAREAKAAEDAKALAVKVKASDRLTAMFSAYDLGSLAGFISRRIMADVSEDMLMLELYDQPEYQLRFPGMKALRGKGKTITEAEYIKDEKAFAQTARFFDIPVGFYDTPDDFGKLIGNLVSPKEFQDRLQVGQDLARSMSPGLRTQLQDLYNVGEGGITAYVLDSDRALPLIQKQAKAAQFVGFGREQGFKLEGMTAAQAEQIAGTEAYSKLSAQQMQTSLANAARLRETQSRLTGIEGEVYNEQEALKAVIEGSPEALLASQQRAQREGARFGGGTGITGSSLRSTPGI